MQLPKATAALHAGLSEPGLPGVPRVPGVSWHPSYFLADYLTLSQLGGGHIMPTTLILLPRIFRLSYGLARLAKIIPLDKAIVSSTCHTPIFSYSFGVSLNWIKNQYLMECLNNRCNIKDQLDNNQFHQRKCCPLEPFKPCLFFSAQDFFKSWL